MQGRASNPCPIIREPVSSNFVMPPGCLPAVEPAEHIIEIRTKRELGAIQYNKDHTIQGCQEGFIYEPMRSVVGDMFAPEDCVRVTREVWIDGVRWGTLIESTE